MSQEPKQTKLTPEQEAAFKLIKADLDAGQTALKAERPGEAIEPFLRAAKALPEDFPNLAKFWQNVLVACRQAVQKNVKPGSEGVGDNWVRTALKIPDLPANAPVELRRQRADLFKLMGLQLFEVGRFGLAAGCHRKALAANRHGGHLINLANALIPARLPAMLSDYAPDLTLKQLAPKLLIACVPKSGSTFLYYTLAKVTSWKDFRAFGPCGQFEQEIYPPSLVENARIPGVIQQHCRATDANLHVLQAFRIRPLVLVRNFADSLLSLLEFYQRGAHRLTIFHGDFPKMPQELQIDMLIELRMPWYFEFVASWQLAEREKRIPPICWVTYEDMIADKVGTLQRALKYWNLKAPEGRVEKIVEEVDKDKAKSRFNVGKAGRGKTVLTDAQHEKLASLARFFPTTDFSMVGFGPPQKPAEPVSQPVVASPA